jgi:hypothetical protein
MVSSLVESDYTPCRRRRTVDGRSAIFLPQFMAGIPELGQQRACAPGLNGGVTTRTHLESKMTTKPANAALNHRRIILDMLELALRGTVAASLLAALAMGLIAFAAS